MDLLNWEVIEHLLLSAGILVAPLALYVLVRRNFLIEKADPRRRAYSQPGWNFPLKKAWTQFCIWRQGPHPSLIKPNPIPFIPSEHEFRVEKPKKILREKAMDGISIYGVDAKRNWLVLRIIRKFHRQSEVWLHLGLADGTVYQLVDHPDTTVPTSHTKYFHAGDLRFTQLEPLRRWRITFNGTLRRGLVSDWQHFQDDEQLVHVRLNFIWIACSEVSDAKASWSTNLLSEALAREHWRSGNWLGVVGLEPPGYDQFGILDGIIRVGENDPGTRLYLRGNRERRWGEVQEESLGRSISLQGVAEDGCFFSLKVTCREDGLTHALWGIVRLPTGMVVPVTECNLNMADIAHEKNLPRQLLVIFSAGGNNFTMSVQFQENQGATLYSGHPWRLQTFVRKIEFGMNGVQGNGVAEFSYKFRGRCPVPQVPVVGQLAASPWETKDGAHPMVCDLTDHVAQAEMLAGGKGASLALLSSVQDKGFTVSPGFCVTTAAYVKQVVSSTLLQASILNVKEITTNQKEGDFKVACEKAMKAFEEAEMNKEIKISIEKILSSFRSDTVFAVRSSAVGEDSEDLSCAGQNLTVLGVRPADVTAAVSRCWGSLFSEHSVQYRRQYGQPLDPHMAVVVQKMVPAETAGVIFTRHPFSGNPRQLVITANYGLGESVVSATVEPDTVVVNRSWNDLTLSVQETTVGSKQVSIVLGPGGEGTKNATISTQDQQRLCLENDQLLALARVGVTIEKLFGDPRDIEWALVKGQIYLLQARPITALNSWTDFELQHEFDMAIPTDTEMVTLANTGEVLPGAITPLTSSVTGRTLDYSIQKQCAKRDNNRTATGLTQFTVGTASHHVMLNAINTLQSNCEAEISATAKIMDLAIYGRIVTDEYNNKLGIQRFGIMSRMKKMLIIYDMIMDTFTAGRGEKKTKQQLKHLNLQAEQHTTAASLLTAIVDQIPYFITACNGHGHMSRVSVFTQIAAMATLTEGKKEWETDHYTDFTLILSSCSDVESAEIPTLLKDLAATIAEEDSEFFCSTSPSEALNWIQTESVAAPKFKAFLQAHGHRAIREFEMKTITWGMQPESLVKVLQELVKSPHPTTDNDTLLSVAETCEILNSPSKESTRRALKFILPYCRTAVARRERSKSGLISAVHTFRLGYRRLAQLLFKEGKIPDTELLFYLNHYEVSRLVQQPDAVLIAKAVKRRKLWNQWENLKFPEISFGLPIPLQDQEQPLISEGLLKLKATPVCTGIAIGRACVITDFSETSNLVQGDILITYCTDIGWSPYFPLLAGIVTELGGLISHGAVIAREYGLPCIVGASNATFMFKTGDLVRINGGTGILEKITDDPLQV